MNSDKKFSDIFDDDFEVTYEEEPGVSLNESRDTDEIYDSEIKFEDVDSGYDEDEETSPLSGYDEYEDDIITNEPDMDDESRDNYDDEGRRSSRRRKGGGVPLAAPIKKGGKLLSRLTSALIRQLSLILILATTVYVTYNFWRASTPYGDVMESLQTRSITITLAVYLCCVAIFILFEMIALLWAMTRTRVHDGTRSWKEDTGRGLLSFVIVFVSSYLAFLFSPYLPDAPDALYGLKGAMNVYGSLHNALFGLCAAGVISCLVRRYKSSS